MYDGDAMLHCIRIQDGKVLDFCRRCVRPLHGSSRWIPTSPPTDQVRTPCGHFFHRECLEKHALVLHRATRRVIVSALVLLRRKAPNQAPAGPRGHIADPRNREKSVSVNGTASPHHSIRSEIVSLSSVRSAVWNGCGL